MTLITFSNNAPIRKETEIRIWAEELKDGSYRAYYIKDTSSDIVYFSSGLESSKTFRTKDSNWVEKCFKIEDTLVYTNCTRFDATEIECK